jgi:hypothetical protein
LAFFTDFLPEYAMVKSNVIAAGLLWSGLICSFAAHAQVGVKPGLWEVTTQSSEMKELPKMSPEQTEQLRKLGVDIAKLQSGAIVTKICISKQMAERDPFPQIDQAQSGCKIGETHRTDSGYLADIVCDSPGMKGKGVVKATYASNESFTTSLEFTGTSGTRQIEYDRSDASGKWLGSDCGSLKPIGDVRSRK